MSGISSYVLKLSAHYLQLGVGEYRPKGYHFEKVVVAVQEPFAMAENGMLSHSGTMMRVEYWTGTQLERYVDFYCAVAGFSGRPIMKTVK